MQTGSTGATGATGRTQALSSGAAGSQPDERLGADRDRNGRFLIHTRCYTDEERIQARLTLKKVYVFVTE